MIFKCYFIVCVNLLYCFPPTNMMTEDEQELLFKSLTVKNQNEVLSNLFTPYWNLPYDKQLERKQNQCRVIVDMILNISGSLENPMPFKLYRIVPSPVTKSYRNRDLFYTRRGIDGNIKTVGFLVSNPKDESSYAVHPNTIVSIKESHRRVAQVYEDFIRISPLLPHFQENDGGHWGPLLVRSNEAGDIMAAITVQPKGYTNLVVKEEKRALKEYFLIHLPNITLYHQQCFFTNYLRCTNAVAPFRRLYGKPYLVESLNEYKLKVTPDSYFPTNKYAAEVLCDNFIKTAKLTPNTTVLEICSGTGLFSMMASKFVREVIAVDFNIKAVKEARNSVIINDIKNIKFVMGTAKIDMVLLWKMLNSSRDTVVIVNSGNSGIGHIFIKEILEDFQIKRVFFISKKPTTEGAIRNFVDLCTNKTYNFPPFRLTKAIPVDALPHTAFIELILMFQRLPLPKI